MVSPEHQPNINSVWNDDMPWSNGSSELAEVITADDILVDMSDDTQDASIKTEVKPKTEWS